MLIETQLADLLKTLTGLSRAKRKRGELVGPLPTAHTLGPKDARVPQQKASSRHSQCFDSQGDKQRYQFQKNILSP